MVTTFTQLNRDHVILTRLNQLANRFCTFTRNVRGAQKGNWVVTKVRLHNRVGDMRVIRHELLLQARHDTRAAKPTR